MILKTKKAFTLIEMMIGMAIIMMVLLGTYSLFTYTRQQFMHGTVNLQNFEDARLAINWLRRDFSSACPYIDYYYDTDPDKSTEYWSDPAIEDDYIKLQELRRDVFASHKTLPSQGKINYGQSEPLQLVRDGDDRGLVFNRFVFAWNEEKPQLPLVEEVQYHFSKRDGTLTRVDSKTGNQRVFKGFAEVDFDLYLLKVAEKKKNEESSYQEVPVLWVYFKIYEGGITYGKNDIGKPLELATSIVSPYIASWMQNRRWRSDLGQKKIIK